MKSPVVVVSSVGGGPMQRLVDRLRAAGRDAVLVSRFAPAEWRVLSRGRRGRWRARFEAMVRTPIAALRTAMSNPGTLVPTTNPFFLPVLSVAAKALHGRPVVALVYDLYPDALEAAGRAAPDSILSRVGASLNRFLFRNADGVVFIGDRMAKHARSRYGAPRRQAIFHTGAVAAEFNDTAASVPLPLEGLGDKVLVSYVGNLGHVHDWQTLRDGLAALTRAAPENVAVVIAGSGPGIEMLERELGGEGREVVRFVPPLADDSWRRLLMRTDIALVSLKEEARHTSVPSKLFSALAAGAAIAAVAPKGSDLADVVGQANCGVIVPPGNGLALLDAILTLSRDTERLRSLQQNAVGAAETVFDLDRIALDWMSFLDEVEADRRPGLGYASIKRTMDVGVAAAALVAFAPVLAGAAAAVVASMGSPILFRQERPGRGGEVFELLKFRSMRSARPGETGPDHDAARLTAVGRFLRATSIDELPALLNVLRGDMSLVGPRPLLVRYLPRYNARQARRHEATPGITGLAQVRGRNSISWEQKFEHDVDYVENRSLWLDVRILVETAFAVLARRGISGAEHATMPEFMGAARGDDAG